MNKKQFALSALAFVVALAVVSCEPLRGCAADIGYAEQAGIYDYLNAGNSALVNIDFQLDEDEDGNRSKRLQIYALQSGMLATQTQIYDNMDFSIAPSTVSVSGSFGTGFYKISGSDAVKTATVRYYDGLSVSDARDVPLVTAPDFNIYVRCTGDDTVVISSANMWSGQGVQFSCSGAWWAQSLICESSTLSGWTSSIGNPLNYLTGGSIPTFSGSVPEPLYSSYANAICGLLEDVELPPYTVDTTTPWDYYNEVLLPQLEEDFPGFEEYFIFPDGYTPSEPPPQIPTEYPTMPGFDFALETNGTEPPSDVNYNLPDLPGKDVSVPVFDFTSINPAEVMAPVANGLKGIWQLVGMVLTEYGLFPYVGLAIFAAIMLMLLRLGK